MSVVETVFETHHFSPINTFGRIEAKYMYKTKNTLSEEIRIKCIERLNIVLASCIDASLNAKQAHWNVKGGSFMSLHELFDDVSDRLAEYSDLIAERIVQLGGIAEGTLPAIKQRSILKVYPLGVVGGLSHVEHLSDALAILGKIAREAIDELSAIGDANAADILTEVSRGVDKYIWFLESHLVQTE